MKSYGKRRSFWFYYGVFMWKTLHSAYCITIWFTLRDHFSAHLILCVFFLGFLEWNHEEDPPFLIQVYIELLAAQRRSRVDVASEYIFYLHVLKQAWDVTFIENCVLSVAFNLNMFFLFHNTFRDDNETINSVWKEQEMIYRFWNSYNCSTLKNSSHPKKEKKYSKQLWLRSSLTFRS